MTDTSTPLSSAVRVTPAKLADGRDLFYFDDSPEYVSGAKTRRLDDPRPLPDRFAPVLDDQGYEHPAQGPLMRLDVLTGEWIPMAAHRMNRTFLPAADSCPLCPAKPDATYQDGEIPDTSYDVAVFENRFPSLLAVPGDESEDAFGENVDGEALFRERPAAGRCEVVCFTSDHAGSLAQQSVSRVRTVIEAWAARTEALSAMPGIEEVAIFENRGKEIGVTLQHPHGQIYAYPYLTPKTTAYLTQADAFAKRGGGVLLREVLDAERRAGRRIIRETEHWTAYVPVAARWPVEVHLAPNRDVPDLPALTSDERDDLADIYLDMLRRFDTFFVAADGTPIDAPYISAWHQAPVRVGRELSRLHLQLFSFLRAPGKLKYLAGSESGLGAWISDTTPERIADRLLEVAP